MVHLEVLGTGFALLEKTSFVLPRDKRGALLIFLAFKGVAVSRPQITKLFWLDTPDFEARRNLRQLMQRVWQLPFGIALARQAPDSRSAAPLEFLGTCDLGRTLEQLKARNSSALSTNPVVLDNWFIADAPEFMAWLDGERNQLLLNWRTLAVETAESLLRYGQTREALVLLERILFFEPLAEDALQLYLEASVDAHSSARALAVFTTFEQLLQSEIGMTPASRTLELMAALEQRPIVARAEIIESRFFGRESEIVQSTELLQRPETRLLTITGFGGTGKTRLAQKICPKAIWVSLENILDETGLLGQIAEALGVRFAGHQDARMQLLNICQAMPNTTLVLDNFEQLLPNTNLIQALLETGLRLIITSREALGLRLEHIFALQGLEPKSAQQLFFERSYHQNSALNPDYLSAQKIVATLDGMPLALELAATWTRTLSLKELAVELERNTNFLDWRGVFEGSWRRLTPTLQEKLCELSVCIGGFDFAAAQELAKVTLTDLAALVRASLLKAEAGRFSMLKLIRHAAMKNLESESKIKMAHAVYYLQWLARLEVPLESDPKNHLEAVTLELENIRTAWLFACQTKQIYLLSAACLALSTYFDLRGLFFEAQQLFGTAANASHAEPSVHAKLLLRFAWADFRLGLYSATRVTLQKANLIYTKLGDTHGQATCTYQLGNVLEGIGDFVKATGHFEIALILLRSLEDAPATARVLNSLGLVALNSGNAEKAVQYHRESLDLRRKSAQPRAMFIAQLNLGDAQKNLGHLTEARKLFNACLQISTSIGDDFGQTLVSSQLADIDRRENRLENAILGFESTIERCRRMGHGYVEVIALRGLGLTLQDLGQLEAAQEKLLQSLRVSLPLQAVPQTNLTLMALCELEQQNDNLTRAWQIANLVLQRQPAPREQQKLEQLKKLLRKKIGTNEQNTSITIEEILPFTA